MSSTSTPNYSTGCRPAPATLAIRRTTERPGSPGPQRRLAIYTASAELLADQSLAQRLRYWMQFDVLLIDEFGFDRIERMENAQAACMLHRVVDARRASDQVNDGLGATNIEFEAWPEYLGDAFLATAILGPFSGAGDPLGLENG